MIIHVDKIRFCKNRLNYFKYKLGSPSKITRDNVFLFKYYNPGLLSINIAKLTVKKCNYGALQDKFNASLTPDKEGSNYALSHLL